MVLLIFSTVLILNLFGPNKSTEHSYPKQLIHQLLRLLGIAALDVPHHGKAGIAEVIDGIEGLGAVERGEGDETGKVEIPKANGEKPLLGLTVPTYCGEIWRCAVLIVLVHAIDGGYIWIFLAERLRQHDIAGTGIGFGGCLLGEVEDVAPITCGLGVAFLFHIDEIYYEVLTVIHWEGYLVNAGAHQPCAAIGLLQWRVFGGMLGEGRKMLERTFLLFCSYGLVHGIQAVFLDHL